MKMAGIASATLLAGIALYFVGLRDRPNAPASASSALHGAPAGKDKKSRAYYRSQDLPPVEAPFHATISALVERADQGDGDAACRLAMEYRKCYFVQQELMRLDDLSIAQGVDRAVQTISMLPESSPFYTGMEHCEGVRPAGPGRVAELLRRSALSGNPAAMRGYALGAAFSTDTMLDDADELRTYKSLGPQIAQSAIEAGDGTVLLSMAAAYQPDNHLGARPLLAQAVSIDVTEAMTLFQVARSELSNQGRTDGPIWDFVNRQLANLEARASAEQRVESDRRAAALRGRVVRPIRLPSDNKVAFVSRATAEHFQTADCSR